MTCKSACYLLALVKTLLKKYITKKASLVLSSYCHMVHKLFAQGGKGCFFGLKFPRARKYIFLQI